MKKFKFKKSYVSKNGDYYQILFDDDLDEPNDPTNVDEVMDSLGQYFLVQFDFEFPSQRCYIESDDENLIGHYIVNIVIIKDRTFTIKYGPNNKFCVSIEYTATDKEQIELIKASRIMFVDVKVYD